MCVFVFTRMQVTLYKRVCPSVHPSGRGFFSGFVRVVKHGNAATARMLAEHPLSHNKDRLMLGKSLSKLKAERASFIYNKLIENKMKLMESSQNGGIESKLRNQVEMAELSQNGGIE